MSALNSRLNQVVSEIAESLGSLFDELPEDRGWRVKLKGLRQDPLNWTENQLFDVQAASRHLCTHNEFAIGGLETRVDYIVGDGFQYRVEALSDADNNPSLVRQVQDFVDRFVEENSLETDFPAEALGRLDEDGEWFTRIFRGAVPSIRWIEPECVRTPPDRASLPSVRLGVESLPGDTQTVLRYWIDPALTSHFEPLDASEVLHVKANVKSRHPRGVPVYYPVDASLRDCEDLLRGMSTTAKARAKIAVLWKTAQLTNKLEEDLRKRITEGQQTDASGNRRDVSVEEFPFGSILRYNGQDQIEMPNANIGSSDTVNVLQARLRSIGTRLRMPEWMFTGLADQKYSNAFVVEAPTYKAFKRVQGKLITSIATGKHSLIWRAIRIGIALGLLPPGLERAIRITCTAPALEVRDRWNEASVNQIYNGLKVKSRRTIQEEQGLDPEQEDKRIEEETAGQEEQGGDGGAEGPGPQLPPPSPTPPGGGSAESLDLDTAEGKGPAGQNPPHPGLVWDPEKRRYVNPNKKKYKTVEILRGDGTVEIVDDGDSGGQADSSVVTSDFKSEFLPKYEAKYQEAVKEYRAAKELSNKAIDELEKTKRSIGEEFDRRLGRPATINDLLPKDLQAEYDKAYKAADDAEDKARSLVKLPYEVAREALKEWLGPQSGNLVKYRYNADTFDEPTKARINNAHQFLKNVLSKSIKSVTPVSYGTAEKARAYYRKSEEKIAISHRDSESVMIHELGHHLENTIPGAKQKVNDFLDKRLAGETPISLKEKFGGNYESDEYGSKDNFDKTFGGDENSAYYTGKRYWDGQTEVLSMGIQALYDDPKKFAENDPEYFDLIIGILHPKGVKRA